MSLFPVLLMFVALLTHVGITISTDINPKLVLLGFLAATWIILVPTLWSVFKLLWDEGKRTYYE